MCTDGKVQIVDEIAVIEPLFSCSESTDIKALKNTFFKP